jgi:hypothetical protein
LSQRIPRERDERDSWRFRSEKICSDRRHLVERYFPHASHQVVILSTDTEVDRHYDNVLQPHVARAYHLCYEEEARATKAEEGYFWREASEDSQLRSRA